MQHVIYNAYTNATLTALFLFVVFSILFYALKVGVARSRLGTAGNPTWPRNRR